MTDLPDWSYNIVRGRMYDTAEKADDEIWRKIQQRISFNPVETSKIVKVSLIAEQGAKYGSTVEIHPRLGHPLFEFWSQMRINGVVPLQERGR
jgi:hypothetical protein